MWSLCGLRSVWADWAIFKLYGHKFAYKSSPNIMVNFWASLNNTNFMWKWFGYFLDNFVKNWATFYFIIWSHWLADWCKLAVDLTRARTKRWNRWYHWRRGTFDKDWLITHFWRFLTTQFCFCILQLRHSARLTHLCLTHFFDAFVLATAYCRSSAKYFL